MISADALIKLVHLKENSDEPETSLKIRSLLVPREYTRLDTMIDVMFTTVNDVEQASKIPEPETNPDPLNDVEKSIDTKSGWEFTEPALLQEKRDQIIAALSRATSANLIKKSMSLYWDVSREVRIACTISKRYTKKGAYKYWYAYHPSWDEFLGEARSAFFCLGCMDLSKAFAIPFSVLHPLLDAFNTTTTEGGKTYWHIHLIDANNSVELLLPKRGSNLDLQPYQVTL